ncbi:MAG: glycosyltransferase [Flaviflexus sp.]|nr:glycosyltransferase [Flaviflexus sp.]
MKILGFGTYRAASHPRVAVLLEGLARRGHTVRELNEPLRSSTSERVAALRSPRGAAAFFGQLGSSWLRLIAGAQRYRTSPPDVVVVGYLGHFDVVLARLLFPKSTIVLDHLIFAADTAKDRGANSALLGRALEALDRLAHACADLVVYDTPDHALMAPAGQHRKGIVVPVGAPEQWLSAGQAARAAHTEGPEGAAEIKSADAHGSGAAEARSVIFYGLFTPLQGTPTIARALRLLHERGQLPPVTLVGTGQDEAQVREILGDTPVTWLDWVESNELPDLVASHDISLGIVGTTPKGRRVVPNKVYQSMAAGCAVITSDTPSQREILGSAVRYVAPGDAEGLAEAIAELAGNGELCAEYQRRALQLSATALRPEQVVSPLAARL